MKPSWKKILLLALAILILISIVAVMIYAKSKYNTRKCKEIVCVIDYRHSQLLIAPNDIIYEINKNLGKQEGKKMGNIDLKRISDLLEKNPFLESVNANMNLNGVLRITAKQRVPILRYITKEGRNLYLDRQGNVMPVYASHPVKIVVATGEITKGVGVGENIFSLPDTSMQRKAMQVYFNLHHVANIMLQDSLISALVEQINVLPDGYMQMITKAGSHMLMYGDTTNAKEKFENLKAFYKKAMPRMGWDKYKKINLQYKNQVVCTK